MISTAERRAAERASIVSQIRIRHCEETDLPLLEWDGAFTEHRQIIRQAFERHRRGENLMLLADHRRYPVGQVWIDLAKNRGRGAGMLWALRVLPGYQRLGIGKRLIGTAEATLEECGFPSAELGVETWNTEALRLYRRAGYRVVDVIRETYSYQTPAGAHQVRHIEEWLLRKELRRAEKPAGPRRLHRTRPVARTLRGTAV